MKNIFRLYKNKQTHFFALLLVLFSQFSYAQVTPQNRGTGALFLPTAQYNALPGPNWADIKSYSSVVQNADGSYTSPAIVMLNNPPIGDQQTQGSCVGWATGYSAMGILTYPKFNCWNNARRSPNYVYNQIKGGTNCGAGSYIIDGINLVKNQGDCSWNLMPYNNADCATVPSYFQTADAGANKAINWAKLDKNDLLGIKQAIFFGFPVVVGHFAYQSFYDMGISGGIWTSNSGTNWGRHATCVVGYDDTRQQLKVQNQWGASWGDNGCFWVPYSFAQNNAFEEVYIVYGATPSIPLAISGPDQLCNNNNGAYNINSLQCNSSVTWSSSNNLVSISSATAPNVTVYPNGFVGTINLTATINNLGIVTTLTKQILIGAPNGAGLVTYNYMENCGAIDPNPNLSNRFSVLPGAGDYVTYSGIIECDATNSTSRGWSLVSINGPGPWSYDNIGNGKCVVRTKRQYSGSYMVLRFTASNVCGNISKDYTFTTDCVDYSRQANPIASAEVIISPNPCSGQFNISLNTTDKLASIKEISIKNKMGVLVLNKKYNNNQSSQSINITNQPADIYIVEIFDGKKWNSQKLSVVK